MSNIEWTQETWNPITGCTKASQGCKHCYAETMATRLQAIGLPQYQGVVNNGRWTGRMVFVPSALDKPLKRRKPTIYFVDSMSDLFHNNVKPEWLQAIWEIMERTPQHIYQILTKREANMRRALLTGQLTPLPNVWLGVSVENRDNIGRIALLKTTPAALRFISFEPLLSSVGYVDLRGIDWAIAGAESGPHARPMLEDWVRGIRDICQRDGVKFFYKQRLENGRKISTPTLDGVQWTQTPEGITL